MKHNPTPTTHRGIRRIMNRIDSKFHRVRDEKSRELVSTNLCRCPSGETMEQVGENYAHVELAVNCMVYLEEHT